LAEYDEWRRREMALARTRGEDDRVPSASVFRRRYGSWERALLASGYSPEEVYVRLEPPPEGRARVAKVDRYSEATLRATLVRCVEELGHLPVVAEFEDWRRRELERTGEDPSVLPSDSPYRRRYGSWEGALQHFGFSAEDVAARLRDGRARSTAAAQAANRRHKSRGGAAGYGAQDADGGTEQPASRAGARVARCGSHR
jgi:Homing endonuclease associated repeat